MPWPKCRCATTSATAPRWRPSSSTSISSNGDGAVDSPSVRRFGQADNPFLKLIDNLRGYHVHEISATQWRTDIRVMDQVQRKGGRISTRASFIVEPHVPRLHRA